jgi:hypothetical protein
MSEHEVDFRFDATIEDVVEAFYDCGWSEETVKCALLLTVDGESIRLSGPDALPFNAR